MQNSIHKELIELKNSKEWIDFENYYMNYDIFNQFDFFRYEDAHTNILKSLLIQENAYGLYTYPLKKLIELLIIKDDLQNKLINKLKTEITIEDLYKFTIDNISIKTQVEIDGNGRLDLSIEFKINNAKYNIILENKIGSGEHDNQCERYYNYFSNLKDDMNYIFVYLSLEKKPKFNCVDKYICINYQELIKYVIEPCSYKCRVKNTNIIDLNSYLSNFCNLFNFTNLSNDELIIPITNYGKQLTNNLNQQYGELLIDILENKTEYKKNNNQYKNDYNNFYELNKDILTIYYYNLSKSDILENSKITSIIENKVLKIKAKFKDGSYQASYQTYKECSVNILKYLIDKKIVNNDEDLEKLNKCVKDNHYLIASKSMPKDKQEGTYTSSHKNIGEIYLNGCQLYYCDYTVTKKELEYFVNEINKNFDNVLEEKIEIN